MVNLGQEGFQSGPNKKSGYNIDDAKELDEAHNILGIGESQHLTNDSQMLLMQQKQLQEMMGLNTEL
jgi:hypothetical protein